MQERRLDADVPVSGPTNGHAYAVPHAEYDPSDIDAGGVAREFSLRSFKCFAREHPLLLGFSAAGIGAAFATLGAGYVLYRGAQRSLPLRVARLAKGLVTF